MTPREAAAVAERIRKRASMTCARRTWGFDTCEESGYEPSCSVCFARSLEAALALETGEPFDDFRVCEFCGCRTNAKLRRCCKRGEDADRTPAPPASEAKAALPPVCTCPDSPFDPCPACDPPPGGSR